MANLHTNFQGFFKNKIISIWEIRLGNCESYMFLIFSQFSRDFFPHAWLCWLKILLNSEDFFSPMKMNHEICFIDHYFFDIFVTLVYHTKGKEVLLKSTLWMLVMHLSMTRKKLLNVFLKVGPHNNTLLTSFQIAFFWAILNRFLGKIFED